MHSRKVEVVAYNPVWPALYEVEAKHITAALGPALKAIYHIGSTAIPNMPAKPVIDMLLVCRDIEELEIIGNALVRLGYQSLRRNVLPHCSYFTFRQDDLIRVHIHLYEIGNPQIMRHINFRDYLRKHEEDAKAYAALKKNLAKQFTYDIFHYVIGKDTFVQAIDAKAKVWKDRSAKFSSAYLEPLDKEWNLEQITKSIEVNQIIQLTHFAQYINNVSLIRIPAYIIVNSGLPCLVLNTVLDANFSPDEAQKYIAEVGHHFGKDFPFSWLVGPHDHSKVLPQELESAGYYLTETKTGAYFHLENWQPSSTCPDLHIKRALDQKTLGDFAELLAPGNQSIKTYYRWIANVITSDDPLEFYVAYAGQQQVACLLSCFVAGIAGLYLLVAREEENLYISAMHEFHLQRAKMLNYAIATIIVKNDFLSFYEKYGYKKCCQFLEYKLNNENE